MTENLVPPPMSVANNESNTSNAADVENFDPEAVEMYEINKTFSRSKTDSDDDILERFSALSKTISHMTAKDMQDFQIDSHDFDLQKILKFLANKNTENGIQTKKADIVFNDLTVIGKNTSASILKDAGDVFLFPFSKIYQKFVNKSEHSESFKKLGKTRKIIKNISGYAEAGTMTLVLGRPGSGCSTFLKVLGGETKTYLSTEGLINYNGIDSVDMFKHHKNQLIYNPELDVHFPFLTVEETMKFAVGCKTPSIRADNLSREEYINNIKDLYEILFGLKHVEKSLVGNDFVRGISGGQRKRVSIAEAMVTRGTVYCFDNATRGLDASTALEFAEALRTSTNVTKTTSLVTIYQASESIYKLFDTVTVLYLGRQVYFGPIENAVSYFENMGFEKANRETSAEFLTAVTDPLARKIKHGFESNVPNNADEFEAVWRNSVEFARLQEKISQKLTSYNGKETGDLLHSVLQKEKQKYTGKKSPYTINYFEQLKLLCRRRAQTMIHNKAYTVTLVSAALVQSLIIGSLYYHTTASTIGAFSRGGVIFFSCLYFSLMCLAEIAVLFEDKKILNKQYTYSMYHPSAELLSNQLVQFPIRCLSVIVFAIVVYFLSDLKREAGPFFTYFLFVNLVVQAVNSLFILLSSLVPDVNAANGICGVIMMSMIVYSSFMIQRPSMYWWFKWFSYCNPVLFGFESMITMEFHNRRMPCTPSMLIPSGPDYANVDASNQVCGFVGASESRLLYGDGTSDVNGDIYLKLSFEYAFAHCWRNLGILFCFIVGYLAVNALLVEFYNPVIASSDQLLFIKGAKLPVSLLEALGESDAESKGTNSSDQNSDIEKDEERNIGFETRNSDQISDDIMESRRSRADADGEKLGSNDIFMWQHVDYVVPYNGEDRKLLDDVQGYVLPGTLTALMGESGAGKTTLLNVLSRRVDVGVVTGDTLINGKPIDSSFERRTGYVQQQDLHIAELTVRESLVFSARLRRPHSIPDEEKLEYVETIINILNMEEYADSIAGVSGYGLNVEQRKKLSIATELVAKPSLLLFLDEPTSGLDSQSSWAIIQVLKELARAGQAILCTIHQPSATLFEEFDRLLLLKKGGQTVYFGDIGKNSSTLLSYFESQGARKCSVSENPAEYVLEAIGAGATATSDDDWYEKWTSSPQCAAATKEIGELIEETHKLPASDNTDLSSKFATPWTYQFVEVLKRTGTQLYRDLDYSIAKFMLMVVGGLLAGFSFWNVKHTTIGMQNVMFACFLGLVICAPLTNQIQARAMESRELYEVRESKSNTFHWSCLLIAQYLNELPYSIVFSTVYFVCWYFPIQLDNEPSRAGFWWFTYCFFFQLYYVSLALAVVYASPDLPSANVLIGLVFNFTISFCGVVQRSALMPGFWKFMWRASPFTYFVENLVGTLLHNRRVVCSTEEYNYLEPPSDMTCGDYLASYFESNSGYVNNPNATSNCAVCQYAVGDEFMSSLGISYYHRWRNIGLFCVYIGFNVVAMIGLYYFFRVKRMDLSGITKRFKKK